MRYILISLLLFVFTAHAEEITLKSIGEDFATPVTTDARYVLFAGTAMTAGLVLIKSQGGDDFQEDTNEHKPMGSTHKFFDYMGQLVPNAIYAGAMYWNYKATNNESSKNSAILMVKASVYSSIVTTVLKYTIQEQRPNHGQHNSFPSGHATTAFAFASVVGMEHGLAWGIPAYLLATGVAYSRLNDNAHYTQDVVAGATIGMAYGIGLALQQQGRKTFTSMPILSPTKDGSGAQISWYHPI